MASDFIFDIHTVLVAALAHKVTAKLDRPVVDWDVESERTVRVDGWEIRIRIQHSRIQDILFASAPDGRQYEFVLNSGFSEVRHFLGLSEVRALSLLLGRPAQIGPDRYIDLETGITADTAVGVSSKTGR